MNKFSAVNSTISTFGYAFNKAEGFMSFNATNVTGLNSGVSYHHAQGNVSAHGFGLSTDTANNLGYGIGRTIRGAFDSLWSTWQKMSTPEPSAIEIAEQRNYMIYEGGLRECVKRLGSALANLQMNPRDRSALKKVEQLSAHFARYLKPNHEGNLRELQSKILKPLEERVSTLARLHMKEALSKWMPVFFQGNNSMSEKAQTELQLAYARQSQVMQEFAGAKVRRSLQEAEGFSASFNSANDFVMTDPEGTDQSYYYSCQLVNGARNVFSYLDARLSKLFTIFPGVSAESIEHNEHEVTVLERDDQNLETARVDMAFIAYVAGYTNEGGGIVRAIDTGSNKVVASIIVRSFPIAIAITPNSDYAYVINAGGSIVSVIDTYSNKVVKNVPVGFAPSGIAITPNGSYAYVTSQSDDDIVIIKISSNEVNKTFSTPAKIRRIAITPNGLYAYVTHDANNSVSVIATVNNTVLTTISVGKDPRGIAITPNGLYAYVANYNNNTISVINTTSNAVIATVVSGTLHSINPLEVAITPNGLYAYVTCPEDNSVTVIQTINNTVVLPTIRVGNDPRGIAITPDGLYVYVTHYEDSTISVINTTSNVVIGTINLDKDWRYSGIAITSAKIPIPNTGKDTDLIIGLSCGGGVFIILLGVGSYLTSRWLKKEESPSELNSLINPLSTEQKMILM